MQKINLTNAEAELLKSMIPKRITLLQDSYTPEEYRRRSWPIEVSNDNLKEYTAKYQRRQTNIKLYQSIINKLS